MKVINTTIKINLLPPDERQEFWPVNRLFAVAALLVFMCFCVFAVYNAYTIATLEDRLTAAQQQLELLRPTQAKMASANSQQQAINAKTNLLAKLTTERKPWYALVARLAVIMPPQIWLDELGTGDKNTFKLKGNALTYPDLAAFMQLLEQDDLFTEPVLIRAERDQQLMVTRFEMNVKIKGLQP
ncbi:PilN domain-containing protein [Sporomusa termitida]|uniref:Fimbrial assembly protein (PilN) n=1 Tax=Sporomusa termitida TaxID=2377 RepID=A0A517DSK0_9FIRM|nr:PilN domain-containing protein [Sporomusa termitida]QDR80330.1 Fimbrial assembly protein (PilN) [Sporomusa termitida]